MKALLKYIAALPLVALCLGACSHVLAPEADHIPGRYTYQLSWDCPAPQGLGNMHVDEEGTLLFRPDGSFADTAMQHHTLFLPDSSLCHLDFDYRCMGLWKVEEGKFVFCEHSDDFHMDLRDSLSVGQSDGNSEKYTLEQRADFADKIFHYYCPRNRWVPYRIERLDGRWFVWSMQYPDGSTMYWRMRRSRP